MDKIDHYKELSKLISVINNGYPEVKFPKVLYHYTNSHGFKGIIEDGLFWASDFRYMNDEQELIYGNKIFLDALLSHTENSRSDVVKEFGKRAAHSFDAPLNGFLSIFLLCFCKDGNILSQWRAYGGNQGSFSIGLDVNDLVSDHSIEQTRAFDVLPVEYSAEVQQKIANNVVSIIVEYISMQKIGDDIEENVFLIASCCSALRGQSAEFILRFKHPSFASEQEWRVVCWEDKGSKADLKFRPSVFGLTPYVELELKMRAGPLRGKLPLKEVYVGPSAYSALAVDAAHNFLKSKGYTFVDIAPSGLPLRF